MSISYPTMQTSTPENAIAFDKMSYEEKEAYCYAHNKIGWCRAWLAKHGEAYD